MKKLKISKNKTRAIKDPTIGDVLEAINVYSTNVDTRLDRIEGDIAEIKGDISEIKGDVTILQKDVGMLKREMVTKEYLNEKIYDMRGDVVVMMRKEDAKVRYLAGLLYDKNIIEEKELKQIFEMEPFPEIKLGKRK